MDFFFRATFVKSKETFWVGVKSSTVVYNGTGTTATVAPTVRFTPTPTNTWNLGICRSVLECCFIFSTNCSVHFRFHQTLIVGKPKSASVSLTTVTQLPAQPVTSWQFRHRLTNLKWPSKCLASLMDMSPLGFQMTREWYMLLYLLMRYQQAQMESADLFYLICLKTFNKQTFMKCGMCRTLGVMGVGLDVCYVSIHCKHPSRCHHFGHTYYISPETWDLSAESFLEDYLCQHWLIIVQFSTNISKTHVWFCFSRDNETTLCLYGFKKCFVCISRAMTTSTSV